MSNVEYFIGKVCTIFTTPINRNYKEENPTSYPQQLYTYFTGVVDGIDNNGIFLTQLQTGLKSFFIWNHVIGIAEEEVLDPKNPKDAEIIEKQFKKPMEQIKEQFAQNTKIDEPEKFIDPVKLTEQLKQLQSKFKT